jgi:cell division protein FtsW
MAARSLTGVYLCSGAAMAVVIPAFLNMYVALSIIPAKGLTLPFFSYGGSSLLVNFAALGLMLSVAGEAGEIGRGRVEARGSADSRKRGKAEAVR